MAYKFFDNVRHLIATTGTSDVTFGTVPAGWQGLSDAGAVDTDSFPYELREGNEWENGRMSISGSVTTGTRIVLASSNGGALIDLQGGAVLTCVALGRDLMPWLVELSDGTTVALDAVLGNVFVLEAAGDRTILVPDNPTDGQKIVIRHKAVSADRTLTLTTGAGGFRLGSDVDQITATINGKTDYIGAIFNLDDDRWDVVAYSKGY